MNVGDSCQHCKLGELKLFQLSLSEAIITCNNTDCDGFLDSIPIASTIQSNLDPLSSASGDCRTLSRSGFTSRSNSPASSQISATDQEVAQISKVKFSKQSSNRSTKYFPSSKPTSHCLQDFTSKTSSTALLQPSVTKLNTNITEWERLVCENPTSEASVEDVDRFLDSLTQDDHLLPSPSSRIIPSQRSAFLQIAGAPANSDDNQEKYNEQNQKANYESIDRFCKPNTKSSLIPHREIMLDEKGFSSPAESVVSEDSGYNEEMPGVVAVSQSGGKSGCASTQTTSATQSASKMLDSHISMSSPDIVCKTTSSVDVLSAAEELTSQSLVDKPMSDLELVSDSVQLSLEEAPPEVSFCPKLQLTELFIVFEQNLEEQERSHPPVVDSIKYTDENVSQINKCDDSPSKEWAKSVKQPAPEDVNLSHSPVQEKLSTDTLSLNKEKAISNSKTPSTTTSISSNNPVTSKRAGDSPGRPPKKKYKTSKKKSNIISQINEKLAKEVAQPSNAGESRLQYKSDPLNKSDEYKASNSQKKMLPPRSSDEALRKSSRRQQQQSLPSATKRKDFEHTTIEESGNAKLANIRPSLAALLPPLSHSQNKSSCHNRGSKKLKVSHPFRQLANDTHVDPWAFPSILLDFLQIEVVVQGRRAKKKENAFPVAASNQATVEKTEDEDEYVEVCLNSPEGLPLDSEEPNSEKSQSYPEGCKKLTPSSNGLRPPSSTNSFPRAYPRVGSSQPVVAVAPMPSVTRPHPGSSFFNNTESGSKQLPAEFNSHSSGSIGEKVDNLTAHQKYNLEQPVQPALKESKPVKTYSKRPSHQSFEEKNILQSLQPQGMNVFAPTETSMPLQFSVPPVVPFSLQAPIFPLQQQLPLIQIENQLSLRDQHIPLVPQLLQPIGTQQQLLLPVIPPGSFVKVINEETTGPQGATGQGNIVPPDQVGLNSKTHTAVLPHLPVASQPVFCKAGPHNQLPVTLPCQSATTSSNNSCSLEKCVTAACVGQEFSIVKDTCKKVLPVQSEAWVEKDVGVVENGSLLQKNIRENVSGCLERTSCSLYGSEDRAYESKLNKTCLELPRICRSPTDGVDNICPNDKNFPKSPVHSDYISNCSPRKKICKTSLTSLIESLPPPNVSPRHDSFAGLIPYPDNSIPPSPVHSPTHFPMLGTSPPLSPSSSSKQNYNLLVSELVKNPSFNVHPKIELSVHSTRCSGSEKTGFAPSPVETQVECDNPCSESSLTTLSCSICNSQCKCDIRNNLIHSSKSISESCTNLNGLTKDTSIQILTDKAIKSAASLDCTHSISTASLDCTHSISTASLDCTHSISTASLDCTQSISTASFDCTHSISTASLDCTHSISTASLGCSISTPPATRLSSPNDQCSMVFSANAPVVSAKTSNLVSEANDLVLKSKNSIINFENTPSWSSNLESEASIGMSNTDNTLSMDQTSSDCTVDIVSLMNSDSLADSLKNLRNSRHESLLPVKNTPTMTDSNSRYKKRCTGEAFSATKWNNVKSNVRTEFRPSASPDALTKKHSELDCNLDFNSSFSLKNSSYHVFQTNLSSSNESFQYKSNEKKVVDLNKISFSEPNNLPLLNSPACPKNIDSGEAVSKSSEISTLTALRLFRNQLLAQKQLNLLTTSNKTSLANRHESHKSKPVPFGVKKFCSIVFENSGKFGDSNKALPTEIEESKHCPQEKTVSFPVSKHPSENKKADLPTDEGKKSSEELDPKKFISRGKISEEKQQFELLPDDNDAYEELLACGYNIEKPQVKLPDSIKVNLGLNHHSIRTYGKNTQSVTRVKKNPAKRHYTSRKEAPNIIDESRMVAQGAVDQIVATRDAEEIPSMVIVSVKGKLFMYGEGGSEHN